MRINIDKNIRFLKDGKYLEVTTPHTPGKWDYYLYNTDFYGDYDIHMQGKISRMDGYIPTELNQGYRYFYIKDNESGEVWNPNYLPLHTECEHYSRIYGSEKMELQSEKNGICTDISIFTPVKGVCEIWTVTLKNNSDTTRDIDIFSVTGLGLSSTMGGECVYKDGYISKYSFPYHVFYNDKEKVEKRQRPYMYMICDTEPHSCDMSQRRFFGSDDITQMPQAVADGQCSGLIAEAEAFCGAMQHKMTLEPGESKVFNFIIGNAMTRGEMSELKNMFNSGYINEEKRKNEQYWEEVCGIYKINTPIPELNYIVNYHIKKQSIFLTKLNRKGTYSPIRNRFQDAIGTSFAEIETARKTMFDSLARQRQDGGVQQWYMTDGSAPRALCLLNHCDGPLWIVICMIILANQIGDESVYDELVDYIDGGRDTVYQHLVNAVYYMSGQLGRHGLCLMHDGDWTDPANGSGRLGRGESTWATHTLVYCINELTRVSEKRGDSHNIEIMSGIREKLITSLNTYAWSGDRYVTGFDDDGKPFGDKADDDRVFLNSQTWAIIAGVADKDKENKIKETLKRLKTPFGYLVVYPAFEEWSGIWGRISVKKSGTTENGAVYCHASVFKALAEAVAGSADEALKDLLEIIPTNPQNPTSKNLQLPIFIPNYYYGLSDSPNFGRSSNNYGTGTIAWFVLILLEKLFGAEKTVYGIKISPNLPKNWNDVSCTRTYKNARYNISYSKSYKGITVDGENYEGEYLPYEEGHEYTVKVGI